MRECHIRGTSIVKIAQGKTTKEIRNRISRDGILTGECIYKPLPTFNNLKVKIIESLYNRLKSGDVLSFDAGEGEDRDRYHRMVPLMLNSSMPEQIKPKGYLQLRMTKN